MIRLNRIATLSVSLLTIEVAKKIFGGTTVSRGCASDTMVA
jgi:hypothetical protein